jgi:hypothetical protein
MLTNTVNIAVITTSYSNEPLLVHVRSCVRLCGLGVLTSVQYDPTGFSVLLIWYFRIQLILW